jgi:hypothetical protein
MGMGEKRNGFKPLFRKLEGRGCLGDIDIGKKAVL